tara:strand:+ start:179 stop:1186 length:1008 start_codon:yes stop_codon:yes gene_type:complete
MKKLILILLAIFFSGIELSAQQISSGNSGSIYRSTGADRGGNLNQSTVFGPLADWSVELVVSEKSPSLAASQFLGPTHNGMGATGWGSFAAGAYNRASGAGAVAIGFHNAAGPLNSDESNIPTSLNPNTDNLGQFAVGYGTQATGHVAFSAGQATTASGYASTAIGNYTIASDYGSMVIGQYNSSGSSATSETTFSTSAPAFVIGNGTSGSLSDAFKVMFNGDTTISNDLTVSGDVVVSSDARLKANIVSLGSTLSKLLLIDGKSYVMKKDGKQKIGVLAQDIQEVFPELVTKDDNEMLAVNYQGLVPVLINALKEQDEKISKLEKLVEQLISEK